MRSVLVWALAGLALFSILMLELAHSDHGALPLAVASLEGTPLVADEIGLQPVLRAGEIETRCGAPGGDCGGKGLAGALAAPEHRVGDGVDLPPAPETVLRVPAAHSFEACAPPAIIG